MATNWYLTVKTGDAVTDAGLGRVEAAAGGGIVSYGDDGAGTMTLVVRPRVRPTAAARKATLEAVRPLVRSARWDERRV